MKALASAMSGHRASVERLADELGISLDQAAALALTNLEKCPFVINERDACPRRLQTLIDGSLAVEPLMERAKIHQHGLPAWATVSRHGAWKEDATTRTASIVLEPGKYELNPFGAHLEFFLKMMTTRNPDEAGTWRILEPGAVMDTPLRESSSPRATLAVAIGRWEDAVLYALTLKSFFGYGPGHRGDIYPA
jgi:hypothetical protein